MFTLKSLRSIRPYCHCQIKNRILVPLAKHLTPNVKIRINKGPVFRTVSGLSSHMAKYFLRCYQPELVQAMRMYLKPGDTFVDVGANVGYITAQAMSFVGEEGQVHAFEPVPQYFAHLKTLQSDNPAYSLHINQLACGAEESEQKIGLSEDNNIGYNTMVPGQHRKEISIKQISLGQYLLQNRIRSCKMIKMDVEGWEPQVLEGLSSYIDETGDKPILIVEINQHLGEGNTMLAWFKRYGYAPWLCAGLGQHQAPTWNYLTDPDDRKRRAGDFLMLPEKISPPAC